MSRKSKGQIELYTHHPFLPTLVRNLTRLGMRVCATYLIESQFMEDKYKFFRLVPPPPFRLTTRPDPRPTAASSQPCPRWSISKSPGSTSCPRWTSSPRTQKTQAAGVMGSGCGKISHGACSCAHPIYALHGAHAAQAWYLCSVRSEPCADFDS